MQRVIKSFGMAALLVLFAACGDDEKTIEKLEGSFVDSPVDGLYYETNSQSGYTDVDGTFIYKPEELVTFYLGNLKLGSAKGKNLLTVIDLNNDSYHNLETLSFRSLQTLQLLQTLDSDNDLQNGIKITSLINDINLSNTDLNDPSALTNIIDTLNSEHNFTGSLVSLSDAKEHFRETLNTTIVFYESYNRHIDINLNIVGKNASGTLYDGDNVYSLYGTASNTEEFLLETTTVDGYYFKVTLQDDSSGNFIGSYIKYDEDGHEYDYYDYEYNGFLESELVGYEIYLYRVDRE